MTGIREIRRERNMMELNAMARALRCIAGMDDEESLCWGCPYRDSDEECDVAAARDALEIIEAIRDDAQTGS